MATKSNTVVTLNNVRPIFKNFAGNTSQYNKDGSRDFSIALDEDVATAMAADGYNVKWPKPKAEIDPEEDRRTPYLQITVSNKHDAELISPSIRIFIIDGENETRLDNSNMDLLDNVDIDYVDIQLNPYHWEVQGNSGIKPYLKTMRAYLRSDDFGESTY